MSVMTDSHIEASIRIGLPDSPHALWLRNELADHLHLRSDGTRVEIIGGEIFVSPGPRMQHNGIVNDIEDGLNLRRFADPDFRWRKFQTADLNLEQLSDGYVPDLVVLDRAVFDLVRRADLRHLAPDQVSLVVEVTSPSTAALDRAPGPRRTSDTKWNGCARTGVPFYLLVDRDPAIARVLLFGEPDIGTGSYRKLRTWRFGEPVVLPAPFGFEIDTSEWEPWDD
jgi:Uma2 family endonuclease